MKKLFWLPLVILSLFISCEKEKEDPYAGCCDNPAIELNVGVGHVYVPNIFTPDRDGINDDFTIYGEGILSIKSLVIQDAADQFVFADAEANPNEPLWDGRENGKTVTGILSFTFSAISVDSVNRLIVGKVCSHPCDEDGSGPAISGLENCQFPTQVTDGRYNANIDPGESNDCFE